MQSNNSIDNNKLPEMEMDNSNSDNSIDNSNSDTPKVVRTHQPVALPKTTIQQRSAIVNNYNSNSNKNKQQVRVRNGIFSESSTPSVTWLENGAAAVGSKSNGGSNSGNSNSNYNSNTLHHDEMREIIMSEFMNESRGLPHNTRTNNTATDTQPHATTAGYYQSDSSSRDNDGGVGSVGNNQLVESALSRTLFKQEQDTQQQQEQQQQRPHNKAFITVSSVKQILPPKNPESPTDGTRVEYDPSSPSYLSIIIPSSSVPSLQQILGQEEQENETETAQHATFIQISTQLLDVALLSVPLSSSIPPATSTDLHMQAVA